MHLQISMSVQKHSKTKTRRRRGTEWLELSPCSKAPDPMVVAQGRRFPISPDQQVKVLDRVGKACCFQSKQFSPPIAKTNRPFIQTQTLAFQSIFKYRQTIGFTFRSVKVQTIEKINFSSCTTVINAPTVLSGRNAKSSKARWMGEHFLSSSKLKFLPDKCQNELMCGLRYYMNHNESISRLLMFICCVMSAQKNARRSTLIYLVSICSHDGSCFPTLGGDFCDSMAKTYHQRLSVPPFLISLCSKTW